MSASILRLLERLSGGSRLEEAPQCKPERVMQSDTLLDSSPPSRKEWLEERFQHGDSSRGRRKKRKEKYRL